MIFNNNYRQKGLKHFTVLTLTVHDFGHVYHRNYWQSQQKALKRCPYRDPKPSIQSLIFLNHREVAPFEIVVATNLVMLSTCLYIWGISCVFIIAIVANISKYQHMVASKTVTFALAPTSSRLPTNRIALIRIRPLVLAGKHGRFIMSTFRLITSFK